MAARIGLFERFTSPVTAPLSVVDTAGVLTGGVDVVTRCSQSFHCHHCKRQHQLILTISTGSPCARSSWRAVVRCLPFALRFRQSSMRYIAMRQRYNSKPSRKLPGVRVTTRIDLLHWRSHFFEEFQPSSQRWSFILPAHVGGSHREQVHSRSP